MALCAQNLSIGIYDVKGSGIVELVNNRIVGLIGRQMDRFLTHKNQRNCLFKTAIFYNEQSDQNDQNEYLNKSVFNLMRKNELDLHAVPQRFDLINKDFEMSKTIKISSYKTGHLINKPNKLDKSNFLSFFINNTNLLIVLLIGYCLVKLFIYLYFKLFKDKFKLLNLFLINLRNRSKLSKISVLILFFNLFLFINLSLFSNSIKTEKVIIKTDQFIDSFDKLNKTSKILTFFENKSQIFKQAPNTSSFYQLYKRKLMKNEIYQISVASYIQFINFQDAALQNKLTNFLFFTEKIRMISVAKLFISLTSNHFLWIAPFSFYEDLNCFYINRLLDDQKKKIVHFKTDRLFEGGFYSQQQKIVEEDLKLSVSKDLKIFESLKEFINEYFSASTDVHLDNYRTIFIYYFGFLIFVLISFIFHHFFEFVITLFINSDLFYLVNKNRLRMNKKKVYKIRKHAKTSRPIYRTNIIVQDGR